MTEPDTNKSLFSSRSSLRVIVSSLVGTSLEFFDFFIYTTTAALFFNKQFFPSFSPVAGTLAAFGTVAVGFAARPLGGVIFGHFGDRIGRKRMLVVALLTMGIATFCVGLLPGYASIGVLAPLALVFLRVLQGIAVGGEWGGAALMLIEHAPLKRRGLMGSASQMGAPIGLLLSTVAIDIADSISGDSFATWGWRLPFFFSAVVVIIGIVIRLGVRESPVFQQLAAAGAQARVPVLELIRKHPRNLLLSLGVNACTSPTYWIATTYTVSYATGPLKMSSQDMLNNLTIAALVYAVAIPVFGALSDRLGHRRTVAIGGVGCALMAFPFFLMVNTANPLIVMIAMILTMSIVQAMAYAPQTPVYCDLFPARVRYTGAGFGYSGSASIWGGSTPILATSLYAALGSTWAISALMVVCSLLGVVSVLLLRPVRRREEQTVTDGAGTMSSPAIGRGNVG